MSSLGIFDKETKTYKKVAGTADDALSATSTNPVQNKVVTSNLTDLKYGEVAGGKNLFKGDFIQKVLEIGINYTDIDLSKERNPIKNIEGNVYVVFGAYLKKGTYTFSYTNNAYFSLNRIAIAGTNCISVTESIRKSYTWTQNTDGWTYFGIEGDDSETGTVDTPFSITPDIQIEEGTQATSYEPYIPSVKMLSEGANKTVVDSGMSDTSTNPVQNKAVKSYVDGRTALDTAMSDTSTKAVQNKVVKSYVDRRTTFDTAMSDTSTNAVQNKVVKSYVDGRTTLDTSMSDSSTKAVQNKVVKSYVDGKFKQKLLAQMPGDGKTGYCQLCTIKISMKYANTPIEITVQERGRATLDRLTVVFDSVDNNDPNLISFKVFGEFGDWYISKRAASTWVIYGQKNELWGNIRVVDYSGLDGVNITWDVTGVTALPDSKTKAVWGGNVNHAVSADRANSVAWNNVTGKPSTYTPSSHTHTKSQITDFPSSLPANGGNASTVNGHTVNSDVPSGAKFTDTNTWRPIGTTADTACAGNDSRLSNARPASDVYAWAKASSKPSYSWDEITGKPSTFAPASHTHNYDSIYLKYKTTKVAYSSTVEVWRAPDPNSQGRLVLFTAHTNSSYHNNTVWFYNKKLHTPNFSSSVGYDATLNNFTVTNYHGIFIVKYHNTDNDAATVKCYDFMG